MAPHGPAFKRLWINYTGLQQLRWDDDEDELPISSAETSPAEDQSSFYLNMSSSKTDDGETIPLVNSGQHQQLIIQDSFPLFKPVAEAEAQDEYLLPIVRVWQNLPMNNRGKNKLFEL